MTFLPSITVAMIQGLMTTTWGNANRAYNRGNTKLSHEFIQYYDYLSHYMTADRVNDVLESCNGSV
jgi:hypothetical protein